MEKGKEYVVITDDYVVQMKDLIKFLDSFNWDNVNSGDILHYISNSYNANFDLRVKSMNKYKVWLKAIAN